MTSANKHIIVLSVILSVACSLAAPIAAQAPDTTAAGNAVQPFRGTDAPLERDASAAQWAGHVVLAVPYAGLAIAMWPVTQGVRINERYKILQRLAEIRLFRQGETEVHAFFGVIEWTAINTITGRRLPPSQAHYLSGPTGWRLVGVLRDGE